MGLIGADDDVVLRACCLADGVDGVFEELFADVELVVGLTSGFLEFFGFGTGDVLDVGDGVCHRADSLGDSTGGLRCSLSVVR